MRVASSVAAVVGTHLRRVCLVVGVLCGVVHSPARRQAYPYEDEKAAGYQSGTCGFAAWERDERMFMLVEAKARRFAADRR